MLHECDINVKESDGLIRIEIIGYLTASAENRMAEILEKMDVWKASKILVVFDGVSLINSAGIAIMIDLVVKSEESDRKLFFSGLSSHFCKIFEFVGLTQYASIVNSEDEIKGI
jgi:anti-anti-sigma factor